MPTIVVSPIGSTRTGPGEYTDLQSWEDDCPANLVTDDKIWKGECYNDSEFTAGVVISGQTVDATRYVWLTAAAGHSFKDHADVRTNPLRYDQSKGVGVTSSTSGNWIVEVQTQYTIIERLQIKTSVYGTWIQNSVMYSETNNTFVRDCILYQSLTETTHSGRCLICGGTGSVVSNIVAIQANTNNHAISVISGGVLVNATVVALSASSTYGVKAYYFNGTMQNIAVFNFSAAYSFVPGATGGTFSYWGSDVASISYGSNHQTSLTFSACFESTTNDFRLKAGSPLIDAGNTDATNAPNDITGTARDATTDGDIGAWEYTAGGGGGTDIPEHLLRMRRPGVVWSNNTGA